MAVNVRLFAAAEAAAGRDEDQVDAATLGEAVDVLAERYGETMAKVLTASSFLLDGVATYDCGDTLSDGQRLDVLPPFAGG